MSPRAAWRLSEHGMTAFDYVGGKMDWLARGNPYEGTADLAGRHLDRDVKTCPPETPVSRLKDLVSEGDWCVVLNDAGVVLGIVNDKMGAGVERVRVGDVAFTGVTTVRPSEERAALDKRMASHNLASILVTEPGGRLLGAYRRQPNGPGQSG